MTIKIGDRLWRYNAYAHNRMGRDGKMMDPWNTSYTIIGESKTHWIVGSEHNPSKVNKKTLREATRHGGAIAWYTEAGMKEAKFLKAHARHIADWVLYKASATHLREIARIVGYKIKENDNEA